MGIKHKATKISGGRGYASEWNDDHKIDSDYDCEKHQALNHVIENRTDWPAGPVVGQIIWRSDLNTGYIWNGSIWEIFSKSLRSATLIVAANDSLDKTRADYVCDGVNDQEEIQQALNDLPAVGGKVLLLEGNYTLYSAPTQTPLTFNKSNTTVEGQGAGTHLKLGTLLDEPEIFRIINKIKCKVCNMWLEGEFGEDILAIRGDSCHDLIINKLWLTGINLYINIVHADRCRISNVSYNLTYGELTLYDGNYALIKNIIFDTTSNSLFRIERCNYFITDNITGVHVTLRIMSNSNRNIMSNNICRNIEILHDTCDHNVLHGNLTDLGIVDNGTNTHLADNWQF